MACTLGGRVLCCLAFLCFPLRLHARFGRQCAPACFVDVDIRLLSGCLATTTTTAATTKYYHYDYDYDYYYYYYFTTSPSVSGRASESLVSPIICVCVCAVMRALQFSSPTEPA